MVKRDGVIYIQIKQGKIMAEGEINNSTIHWKRIKESTNVHRLSFEDTRGFYLGESRQDQGKVLTGLQINKVKHQGHHYFTIKTKTTPYDYATGDLKGSESDEESDDQEAWDDSIIDKLKKPSSPELVSTLLRHSI